MAGDTPPVSTQDFPFNADAAIGQFVPLTRSADSFVPWTAGSSVDAVSAYPIAAGPRRAAVYTAGMFNIDALAWPTGTTEADAMAAMQSDVKYRKLLYSDQRTGNESDEVGPGNEAGQLPSPVTLDPASGALAGGTVGTAYNQSIAAGGGATPYSYAVTSGSLPTGTALNSSTGAITGSPTAAGSYTFTITATDANGHTKAGTYSVAVAAE